MKLILEMTRLGPPLNGGLVLIEETTFLNATTKRIVLLEEPLRPYNIYVERAIPFTNLLSNRHIQIIIHREPQAIDVSAR